MGKDNLWELETTEPLYSIEPDIMDKIKIKKCGNGFLVKYYERLTSEEAGTVYAKRTWLCENVIDEDIEDCLKDKLEGDQIGLHKLFQFISNYYTIGYPFQFNEESNEEEEEEIPAMDFSGRNSC